VATDGSLLLHGLQLPITRPRAHTASPNTPQTSSTPRDRRGEVAPGAAADGPRQRGDPSIAPCGSLNTIHSSHDAAPRTAASGGRTIERKDDAARGRASCGTIRVAMRPSRQHGSEMRPWVIVLSASKEAPGGPRPLLTARRNNAERQHELRR
jgi:hypothetical protein